MKDEFVNFELILETHNPGDIAFIKSILLAEEIEHLIQGETVAPYLFNALPMRLLVVRKHAEKAKKLLKDMKLSFTYNVGGETKE